MKRKIKLNVWGNWNGYVGTKKAVEFGSDEIAAGHWMLTGEYKNNAGYESDETIKAAKIAATEAM